MNNYALNELDRRIANLIRIGTVSEVDASKALARIELADEVLTDWLACSARRAGDDKTWDLPDVGEQVIVFSPGGELDQGIVLGSLFSDTKAQNGDNAKDRRVTFKDGSIVEFDRNASKLNVTLSDAAVFTLKIGAMEVKVTKDGAEIGSGGPTEYAGRADKIKTELERITNAFNGHTHTVVLGACTAGGATGTASTTGGPSATPQSVACAEVKIK